MAKVEAQMEKTVKHREACKRYYESHKEEILNKRKMFRINNRYAFNKWYREYYAKNRDKIIAKRKKKNDQN